MPSLQVVNGAAGMVTVALEVEAYLLPSSLVHEHCRMLGYRVLQRFHHEHLAPLSQHHTGKEHSLKHYKSRHG